MSKKFIGRALSSGQQLAGCGSRKPLGLDEDGRIVHDCAGRRGASRLVLVVRAYRLDVTAIPPRHVLPRGVKKEKRYDVFVSLIA